VATRGDLEVMSTNSQVDAIYTNKFVFYILHCAVSYLNTCKLCVDQWDNCIVHIWIHYWTLCTV